MRAKRLFPIHWGTFNLAFHDWSEPPETLYVEAGKRGVDLVVAKIGEPVEPTRAAGEGGDGRGAPWWRALPPIAAACPAP